MRVIDAVNIVLRNNVILRGDDDNLTNFSDQQHEATSILAQQAIRSELTYIASFRLLPSERKIGTITAIENKRTYELPEDFVEMYGEKPFLYEQENPSRYLYEYPGGYEGLRLGDRLWHQTTGEPNYFYFEDTDAAGRQMLGLWHIPNENAAGNVYVFDYEKSVSVSAFDDLIPFHTVEATTAFTDMASRRFLYLIRENLNLQELERDFAWREAKAALLRVLLRRKPKHKYGRRHHTDNYMRSYY